MRFTLPLAFPQRMRRLRAASWQRWRKQKISEHEEESTLRQAGIPVYEANEFLRTHKDNPLFIDYDAIPEAEPIFPKPPRLDRSNPNWHDTPCRIFDDSSFPIEGLRQAQVFTKSIQVKQGLPDSILDIGYSTKLKDQDDRIQRIIKQAYLWDAYLEKLPKLRDLEIPEYSNRRKYGIPIKRSNEIVIRNMIQLIETQFNTATDKVIGGEHQFRVNMERHDSMVQFKLTPMLTMFSKSHLKPFVDQLSISETSNIELPNIAPFLSTANIEDNNVYETTDYFAIQKDNPFPSIHTTFFSHHIPGSHTHIHPRWNDDRFSGTTALYAFATSLLMAKQKYGSNFKSIEEPVTTQVVHFTGQDFQFAVFQLNTIDLEEGASSKVKNILWITEKVPLFSLCRYKWGKEILEGYNSEAFKILMGMCASQL